MSYTDAEIIASIREDAFNAAVKVSALQHHMELRAHLLPHLTAVMDVIDGMAS